MYADPYHSGVLDKAVHERLVANLPHYVREAGISPHWVWTRLSETCGDDVVDYVRRINGHRTGGAIQGLALFRKPKSKADPAEQMSAIAGALLRNFVNARVMTLLNVLDALDDGEALSATCLLIPNFCLNTVEMGGKGDKLPAFKIQALYDLLVRRASAGRQTVVYSTDRETLGAAYGTAIQLHVETHFIKVEI